jgi:hypothetical protein
MEYKKKKAQYYIVVVVVVVDVDVDVVDNELMIIVMVNCVIKRKESTIGIIFIEYTLNIE